MSIDKSINAVLKKIKNWEGVRNQHKDRCETLLKELSKLVTEKIVKEKLLNKFKWHVVIPYGDGEIRYITCKMNADWDPIIKLLNKTDTMTYTGCDIHLTDSIRLSITEGGDADLIVDMCPNVKPFKDLSLPGAASEVLIEFIKEHKIKIDASKLLKKRDDIQEQLIAVNKNLEALKPYLA